MKKIVLLLLFIALTAEARIGGGDSYSGDSSSSSSSSDSSSSYSDSSDSYSSSDGDYGSSGGGSGTVSDVGVFVIFVLFIFVGGFIQTAMKEAQKTVLSVAPHAAPESRGPVSMAPLRQYDPNFSEIVFTDFCYSLFARVHEARGSGRLANLAPYVDARVRAALTAVAGVDAIVVGSFTVVGFRGIETQAVEADVEFEANYTEGTERWYVREVWTLTRARDVLSPHPEKSKAEHCPKCGAALETRTDGACLHCGTVIKDGTFHWFVTAIDELKKEARPPQLGGASNPERGLSKATVIQPWFGRHWKAFLEKNPGFSESAFEERVRHVARELQDAWTSRDWHRARPLETDALFQTHRYWIDEYLRQNVQNRVESYQVGKIEIARVTSDAFYDAITVRIYGSGRDYTVDGEGNVIGGSQTERREWSEYWTFIRGRAAAPADTRVCPNCGGALSAGQTAICEYCGGKITLGEFPWVLSRIEQDESYRG